MEFEHQEARVPSVPVGVRSRIELLQLDHVGNLVDPLLYLGGGAAKQQGLQHVHQGDYEDRNMSKLEPNDPFRAVAEHVTLEKHHDRKADEACGFHAMRTIAGWDTPAQTHLRS
jgi:hypothetical protein